MTVICGYSLTKANNLKNGGNGYRLRDGGGDGASGLLGCVLGFDLDFP